MTHNSILVIGIGNELRGDDNAGRIVANQIEKLNLPDVSVLSVVQLTPEMAENLSKVSHAIFIDASHFDKDHRLRVRQISASTEPQTSTHSSSPEELLGLTARLYQTAPISWAIDIPAESFELTTSISETAQRGILLAEGAVMGIVHSLGCDHDHA
jgi:hydrogenase maturation protease